MPQRKLTDLIVENVKAPTTGRLEFWDALLPGFGLRVTEKGSKSWVLLYRLGGRDAPKRRLTIGIYPAVSLAKAREHARAVFDDVARGVDPASTKREQSRTVSLVADQFIERYAKPRNRSWKEAERILARYVKPKWGARLMTDITRHDVIELLDSIVDRGTPVMAKLTHSTIRKFFNWALDRGVISVSPCIRVPSPAKANERDRVLSDDELCSVWAGCDRLGWPFGPVVQMLALTGQRRDEVATMSWRDIDLKDARWALSREKTKNKRAHEVPISPGALAILRGLPKVHDELVFTTNGRVPVAGFSMAKRRLDALVATIRTDGDLPPIVDWHLHDLRRTMASGMARLGVAPHVIEKVLNHHTGAISGVAAIYNRYDYQREKRQALEAWGDHVANLLHGARDVPHS